MLHSFSSCSKVLGRSASRTFLKEMFCSVVYPQYLILKGRPFAYMNIPWASLVHSNSVLVYKYNIIRVLVKQLFADHINNQQNFGAQHTLLSNWLCWYLVEQWRIAGAIPADSPLSLWRMIATPSGARTHTHTHTKISHYPNSGPQISYRCFQCFWMCAEMRFSSILYVN